MSKKKENESNDSEELNMMDQQQKLMETQMIDQQLKQVQQYLETFDKQIMEIRHVTGSLNEFSKLNKGDSILAPIANGIFIKVKIEETDNVNVNVGNQVVANKTVKDAIKLLEKQEEEISVYRDETMTKYQELMLKMEEIKE
jgi:prefoldin alpha subunit